MEKVGRKCRELMVEQLVKHIGESESVVITNYNGLKVSEMEELKNALRQISVHYKVTKNSLLKCAFKRLDLEKAIQLVEGAVAVGFGGEDAIGISKILVNFKKKHSSLVICGGFLDKELVSSDLISELAALPAREVLLARFIGGLKSPVNGFVSGLSGILRKLVCVIDAIKNVESSS